MGKVKTAATRLVKELRKLDADKAVSTIKDKNLGQFLHGRSVKTLKGGGEGVTELRGNKNLSDGVEVKKYIDLDSPVVSLGGLAEKTRITKQLNADPSTANLFTKYIPGSFKANKKGGTAVSSSKYSPNDKPMSPGNRMRAVDNAKKVTGKDLTDITTNDGNARNKVIDFMSPEVRKQQGTFGYLENLFKRKKRGAKSETFKKRIKAVRGHKDLSQHVKEVRPSKLFGNVTLDDAINNFARRKNQPNAKAISPHGKGVSPQQYNKNADDYIDKVVGMTHGQRLNDLKRRFHSKS